MSLQRQNELQLLENHCFRKRKSLVIVVQLQLKEGP